MFLGSSLADIREEFKIRFGYPERGDTGKFRLNKAVNDAIRYLVGDMPESLMREDYRFSLELPRDGLTFSIDTVDPRVAILTSHPAGTLTMDGSLSARWVEFYERERWVQRRIREVIQIPGTPLDDAIVIDEPWDTLGETGLSGRIYTAGYPYPADVQKIRQVVIDPEDNESPTPHLLLPRQMTNARLAMGWRETGRIEGVGRGPFYQMPGPHYAPVAYLDKPAGDNTTQQWGWDPVNIGIEHSSTFVGARYEAAGTFSYIVCHGWGRLPWLHPTKGKGFLAPFYVSAPSAASNVATTTWGAGRVILTTPNVSYIHGFGGDTSYVSTDRSGIEKWIFRARTATETVGVSNHAEHTNLENDGVYYLVGVTPGWQTTFYDQGNWGPPDKFFPLKRHNGHHHVVFDRQPSETHDVLLDVIRRPPTLEHDADVPGLPAECYDAMLYLMAAMLTGDKDGHLDRKSFYFKEYERERDRLIDLKGIPEMGVSDFQDGLGIGYRSDQFRGGTITWT